MSGILTLTPGSPHWYLSPDFWVQPHGTPDSGPPGVVPEAGKSYDVYVRVHNMYSEATNPDWNLFVEWAIGATGNLPLIQADFLNGTVLSGVVNGLPIGVSVPAASSHDVKCATTWVPVYENGGHECLIAAVYNAGAIGTFPYNSPGPPGSLGSLNGNAGSGGEGSWSIAQKNLAVLMSDGEPIRYPFRMGNFAGFQEGFTLVAQQAPLSGIAAFLSGLPGGETVLRHPGKVAHLGIVPSTHPEPRELEVAQPRLEAVKIPSGGHHEFTLVTTVREGNALINVTQHLHGRMVGGLSVLVLAKTK
jgi:hypothetical protein